jgi:Fe-S cluster assembly scaffold protein SufB
MASAAAQFHEWVTPDRLRSLSGALHDPPLAQKAREDSYQRFLELPIEPNPLYRGYGYFTGVDLSDLDPLAVGPRLDRPPAMAGAIRIFHDASGTSIELPSGLASSGVRVVPLSEIWGSGDSEVTKFFGSNDPPADRLTALAGSLVNRGYRLEIPDGFSNPLRVQEFAILSRPHEALSVRRVIRGGNESQLLLSEEVFSAPGAAEAQRLYASSTSANIGERAKAVFLTIHAPDLKAVSIYRRSATTGPGARVAWMWNGLGGFRSKVRNQTMLAGSGSHVDDLQTFYGAQNQSYDSSVDYTHVGTDTQGQSITRGVFTDQARGMSRGLVRIEPNARKTIAYVSEHAMLLARGARSDTIPILEILCRDVKATHSTSVAPVDPEKIFYLETRGIGPDEAIRMIGEGFLSYVLDRSPVAGLREFLYPLLAARWEGRDVLWKSHPFPVLPFMSVMGTEAAPEWRFDTKLR